LTIIEYVGNTNLPESTCSSWWYQNFSDFELTHEANKYGLWMESLHKQTRLATERMIYGCCSTWHSVFWCLFQHWFVCSNATDRRAA